MTIVTRYAPSPTGALHIGGARTALFCWAFARHSGGRFLLRFEDTDRERSTVASEAAVLEALEWLGIDWDPVPGFDGIPRQSERIERYREAIEELLAMGHAYRCVCTPAEVEAMRERARAQGRNPSYDRTCRDRSIGPECGVPHCVRLRIPEAGGLTRWKDLIAGPSGEDVSQLDDFVLARSDGTPVYHLAVVIDDHDMQVTHVIRGREHMTSTPRQLLIYQALGYEPPLFAHVPLLVEPGGKKLSKRVDSVSVQSYRDRGFPPEAVLNYIARLGWGHGDTEIVSLEEFARLFTLDDVSHSPSQVHDDKLLWLSHHYIKTLPAPTLHRHVQRFLDLAAGHPVQIDTGLASLLDLLRERSQTLIEMAEQASCYWAESLEYDAKAAEKFLKPEAAEPLADLRHALAGLDEWDRAHIERAFHCVLEAHALSLGKLAQPVRVAMTGRSASPGIFETLETLGRERVLARLADCVEWIQKRSPSTAAHGD
jgi:glutamyl-tRNA synthetase